MSYKSFEQRPFILWLGRVCEDRERGVGRGGENEGVREGEERGEDDAEREEYERKEGRCM